MSSPSNDRAGLPALVARLGAALAASAALHAGLIALLGFSAGAPWRIAWDAPAGPPLQAGMRLVEDGRPGDAPRALAPGGSGVPSLAPHYFLSRELDVRPGIMTRVHPEYPRAAARRLLSGSVVVRLYIDESGRVEKVQTLRATPPGYFERSAEEAFRTARFTPGIKGGAPVKVQLTLEVTFSSPEPPPLPGP